MVDFSLREELNRFWKNSTPEANSALPDHRRSPTPLKRKNENEGSGMQLLDIEGRGLPTPMQKGRGTCTSPSGNHRVRMQNDDGCRNPLWRDQRDPKPWRGSKAPSLKEWAGSRKVFPQDAHRPRYRSRSRSGNRSSSRHLSRRRSRSSSSSCSFRIARRASRSRCSSRSSSRSSSKNLASAEGCSSLSNRAATRQALLQGPAQNGEVSQQEEGQALPPRKKNTLRGQGLGAFDIGDDGISEVSFLQKLISDQAPLTIKKRREVFVGNLTQGQTTPEILADTMRRIIKQIPDFSARYPEYPDPVRAVTFPPNGCGTFAFVEMYDEVLANTAISLTGLELCGRPVKVRRPTGYMRPSYGEIPPLEVHALRDMGFLPPTATSDDYSMNARRELYFGNLLSGSVNEEVLRSLLMPVCEAVCKTLDMTEVERLSPITKVTMMQSGTFAFIQFVSSDLTSKVLPVFDGTELFGRKIKVGRPSAFEKQMDAKETEAEIAKAFATITGTVI